MIYIHIPYCRSFCTYCDFYSEIPMCGFAAYVDALCAEIAAKAEEIPWENNSLYIGGGTPSVLPLDDLRRIVTAVAEAREAAEEGRTARKAAREADEEGRSARKTAQEAAEGGVSAQKPERDTSGAEVIQRPTMADSPTENDRQSQFVGKREKRGNEEKGEEQTKAIRRAKTGAFEEFTMEVNPDDIVRRGVEYVRGLAALGVNRISMGVQSLDDRVLKWMNRRHNAAQAREAYRIIQEAGIDNISLDLIFGYNYPLGNAAKEESSSLICANGEKTDVWENKGEPTADLETRENPNIDLGIEVENPKKRGKFAFETKSEENDRRTGLKIKGETSDWAEEENDRLTDLKIEGETSNWAEEENDRRTDLKIKRETSDWAEEEMGRRADLKIKRETSDWAEEEMGRRADLKIKRETSDGAEEGNDRLTDLKIEGETSYGAELGLEALGRTIEGFLNMGGKGQPPKHISAYQLSVEEGSELAAMVASGQCMPASDEVCARQYEYVCEKLAAAGYRHYEISNFALPGFEAQHNSSYWKYVPYIGFGPAAHSFIIYKNSKIETPNVVLPIEDNARAIQEDGADTETANDNIYIRKWDKADINAYLKAAESGDWQSIAESETLTAEQIREEKIMLALRTADGIETSELTDNSATSRVAAMLENGLLTRQGSRVRIPENKFFVSDDIISDLI